MTPDTTTATAAMSEPVFPNIADSEKESLIDDYVNILDAMTREGLHDKASIAWQFARLRSALAAARDELTAARLLHDKMVAEHGQLRDALKKCVSAIDGLLGDSELPEDDRPGVQAMRVARDLLDTAALSPGGSRCDPRRHHRPDSQRRSLLG